MPDDASAQPPATAALQAELAMLRQRVRELEGLTRQLNASAALQDLRTGAQGTEARDLHRQIRLMQSSTIWRATWPVRLLLDLARGGPVAASAEAQAARRLVRLARTEGLATAFAYLRGRFADRAETRPSSRETAFLKRELGLVSANMPVPGSVLAPCVLIIAELTLPQCAKYRVWQKQEFFARLGVTCRVVDWRYPEECLSAASLATQAILYRVPGFPPVLGLIERLHALRVPVFWEVDDLIFDHDLFVQNRNVQELDEELRKGVISGIAFYRSAMLACGAGIASTDSLARAMRQVGLADVWVVENALDADTLALAEKYCSRRQEVRGENDGRVVIIYGSGTKTHNADFRQAAGALLRLLQTTPRAHLRIVGELELDGGFAEFAHRVEYLPPCSFPRFMQLLAESDISIAPLEPGLFNDAKSNIKFLEASILSVPSVCSPRANFAAVLQHGVNGLLAEGEDAWFDALSRLVADAGLRERLGRAALETVKDRYDPDRISTSQVTKLLARAPDQRRPKDLRVLFANIYFAPRSFGGATLVVEEMARRLHAMPGTEVHVVTGLAAEAGERAMTRDDQVGMAVFALPVASGDIVGEFDNPSVGIEFGRVLDAVQPDVVHLHAVQWLGASLATACMERGIPYVITLHDAWWLCARQFMVQANGRYCFQERIDLHVCQTCMQGARHLEHRADFMRAALDGAALLLSPSEAHRKLYLANGIFPEKIEVAPNGVRMPDAGFSRRRAEKLRFAYVGGDVVVKGFAIVKAVFEALERADWELVLVDNTQNLGFSTLVVADWQVRGQLSIVPAYTQEGMDDFYAGIDVLLFPSQWKESFGLTVREALVRGVWVIATDGGGPAEAISDGKNGTLIPLDGRHDGLLHAIRSLLEDPAKLDRFTPPPFGAVIDYDAQAAALRATLGRLTQR